MEKKQGYLPIAPDDESFQKLLVDPNVTDLSAGQIAQGIFSRAVLHKSIRQGAWIFVIAMLGQLLASRFNEKEFTYEMFASSFLWGIAWAYGTFIAKWTRAWSFPMWHTLVWFSPLALGCALGFILQHVFGFPKAVCDAFNVVMFAVMMLNIRNIWSIVTGSQL